METPPFSYKLKLVYLPEGKYWVYLRMVYKLAIVIPPAGGHFGLPKITFDRISRHFRSICNFFLNCFCSKWHWKCIGMDQKFHNFKNRKQYVEYNGAKSNKHDKGDINIGVPQGSIFGPFYLYYNNNVIIISVT